MYNTILIGSHIKKMLSADLGVTSLVGDNIFPVAATRDVKGPFIVYLKTHIDPSFNKDGQTNDVAHIAFHCVSPNYDEANLVANAIRQAIDNKRYFSKELHIVDIRMVDGMDDFDDENDLFLYVMEFQFVIGN